MHRRDLFRLAAAAALSLESGRRAVAGPNRTAIPLGFSLYGMRSLPTDEALRTLAALGYDSAELCLLEGFETDPAQMSGATRRRIARTLDETALGVPALMENLPLAGNAPDVKTTLERLRRAAELAHQLDPAAPPLIETILGGKNWEADKESIADGVAAWAELAEAERITIAVKPHRMHAMNRPEHALWLLGQIDSPRIKLAYDYSHFALRDLSLQGTLAALLPHTAFVHVKDVAVKDGRTEFALPGAAGTIDYAALFAALRDANYVGHVCVEVSSMLWRADDYDPVAAARFSHTKLRQAMR